MKLISHRGNIDGKQLDLENDPEYIERALDKGYDVEIDVWYDNGFYLGHDKPQYEISSNYLVDNRFWCHAKNGEALVKMKDIGGIHYFWHQEDDYTLTSQGFIWTFPKKLLYYNSVCVLPERGYEGNISNCYAICSDNIEKYRSIK